MTQCELLTLSQLRIHTRRQNLVISVHVNVQKVHVQTAQHCQVKIQVKNPFIVLSSLQTAAPCCMLTAQTEGLNHLPHMTYKLYLTHQPLHHVVYS
jgi:hypothetical protein